VTAVFPFVEQGPRTAVIEALVDNPGRRLLPGQYVTMQFAIGRRDQALIVPASAVVRMGGKAILWVVKDGRAEPREVVSGLRNAERVEITEGLTGEERLVARGQEGLYAGARVSEVPGSSPPAVPTAPPKRESPALPEMKDMPGMNMPGMKDSTDAPTKPKEGSHAGH
jgi:multidrug efflux pump subunit AcrA (membrane-fusion protein)